jgi:hypothetical protein
MTYSSKVLDIIEKLKFFLLCESTKLNFRVSEKDFSRQSGKLSFMYYALLGISLLGIKFEMKLGKLKKRLNNVIFYVYF